VNRPLTGLPAVKLRRDLRSAWPRFVLMVIAIAAGLTVSGGMLYAWATVGRETRTAYLSTQPASATIVLDEAIDADRMVAIADQARRRPQIIGATGRTQFDSDIQVNGQPRTLQLQTFVATPDDPMRMAKFDVGQEGIWPPAPGQILLGRDSLNLLGITVGDTLTLTAPQGRPARLRVAGTVYDPSLAPSPQYQKGHGYLSAAELAAFGRPAALDQLKIQVAEPGGTVPSRNRGTVTAVAGDLAEWLQREQGVPITEIQIPEPYAHPHQWQAEVLLLSLLAGGTAALLLATILVSTMLDNLLTRQIPQIGIMKAIGARTGRIARLYLAMTLLVAAAATLVALGPAIWLGRDRVQGLLARLGIEPVSLAAPWWVYAVIVVTGLGLPPLMALPTLIRTARTTVRAAIDHHGGTTKPGKATRVLARLSRIRRLDRSLLLALRNTVRRPARFWLSVALLAAAGAVFVAGMSLRSATQASDEQNKAQRYWDVEVELAGPARPQTATDAIEPLPEVDRVEAWTRLQIGIAEAGRLPVTNTYPDQGHGSISINTVPADATRPPPKLLEGRRLNQGETGAVVLGKATRDKTVPGLGADATVRLFIDGKASTWRIAGIVEEADSNSGGAYTTPEALAAATGQPQQVNRLRLITSRHDEPSRQAAARDTGQALTGAGIDVGSAASVSQGTEAASAHLGPVLAVLLTVALPLGLVGGIGLASTMSANILDRFREFGVMHAIGARPKAVRRIVVAEGLFLGLTSCLVAAVPALALTAVLGTGLGNLFGNAPLPYRISPLAIGTWLALVVLGSMLATEAAASRASRITVREALTYL
jgi:putative ABC transport system permease protein